MPTTEGRQLPVSFFFVSCFLSLLGANAITNYSAIVYTKEVTGSNTLAGLFFFLNFLPAFALTLYSGVLLDTYSRKKILLSAYFIYAISTALFARLASSSMEEAATLIWIGVASLLTGVGLAIAQSARFAMLGSLASPHEVRKLTMVLNLLIILGFCLAPVSVEWARAGGGWPDAFSAMSALFVVAGAMLFLLVPDRPLPTRAAGSWGTHSFLEGLARGVRHIFGDLAVRNLLIIGVIPLCVLGAVQVVVPPIGVEILGLAPENRALLISAFGLGLILGGAGSIPLMNHPRFSRVAMMLHVVLCGLLLSLSILRGLGSTEFAVILLLVGVLVGVYGNVIPSNIQGRIPDALRGRIMSIYSLLFLSIPAISGVAVGSLADQLGLLQGLAAWTLVLFAGCLTMFARRYFEVSQTES